MAGLFNHKQLTRHKRQRDQAAALLCSALALAGGSTGCSRNFWRNQAELDAYSAIQQNLTDERWAVPRVDITADPRSRFYDPHDPDCSPLPPDDPAAHVYMHWVDGWQGYKCWHKFGDLMSVENPQWLTPFGIKADAIDPISGEYMAPLPGLENVTLGQSIELTLIHSRDYQTRLETVFQSALNVSQSRYNFAVKYVTQPNGSVTGNSIPGRDDKSITARGGLGLSQTLPAGTEWAVDLANTTLWTFSGTGTTTSASSIGFSIVQPLFQQAGRIVGLENLTQVERDLLYSTRDLARFRKILFVNVVGGGNGFLSLLRQLQGIRNQQGNIERTQDRLRQLLSATTQNTASEALAALPANMRLLDEATGTILDLPEILVGHLNYNTRVQRLRWRDPMTPEQAEALRGLSDDPEFLAAAQSIIDAMNRNTATIDILNLQSELTSNVNNLRSSEAQLQDTLDGFKFLIGLPPDMYMTIDDSLLKPFQLIDPVLTNLEKQVTAVIQDWTGIDQNDPNPQDLQRALTQIKDYLDRVRQEVPPRVSADIESVRANLPQRIAAMETDQDAQQLRDDLARGLILFDEATKKLTEVVDMLSTAEGELSVAADAEARKPVYYKLIEVREGLLQAIRNMSVVMASYRVELIDIQPFDLDQEEVIALAMENRLDLMNQRGQVMDARRQVEVTANALKSVVSLTVNGQIRTPTNDNTPFEFRGDASALSTGLAFTAPTDRLRQRNEYRQAIIGYQRARRNYMQFEDQVKQDVRRAWRNLIVQRRNLETSRRAVRIAALQYDSNVNDLSAPVQRVQTTGSGGLTGQNLTQALRALLNAQNSLIGNWIGYEQNRLNIYRDMDIMVIGPDGVWNDPLYRDQANDQNSDPNSIVPQGERHPLDPDGTGAGLPDGSSLDDGTAQPQLDHGQ